MNILLSAILPIALVALSGAVIGRVFSLELRTLARLNIYLLVPALVLTGIYGSELQFKSAALIVICFLLNCAVLYAVAQASAKVFNLSVARRKSLTATTLLANTANIGLPFILFSLGEAAMERAIVYLVASALFIACTGPVFLKEEGLKVGLVVTLKLPVLWATVIGIILQTFAWTVPIPLDRALEMISAAAIPIALVTLGIQLSQTKFSIGMYEAFAVVLRLIVSPISAYGIGTLLGLEGLDLAVLVLQSAMPVAVNTLIWVTEFGGDPIQTAKAIVLSTVASFITLPTVLWIISLSQQLTVPS